MAKNKQVTRDYAKRCVYSGWHSLVDELFDLAEKENFTVVQVKEKFAALRIYVSDASEMIYKQITDIEIRSSGMCEICGKAGETVTIGGWLKTRCWTHV